jgi:hypothetical protein
VRNAHPSARRILIPWRGSHPRPRWKPLRSRAQLSRLLALVGSVACLSGASCRGPLRSSVLIDAYRTADCVTPTFATGVQPPTRGWDTPIAIAGGAKATVVGADMVGGNITIRYAADGVEVVAAQPGDYIYPNDVRLNRSRDRMYVKARGAAGGIWEETWLYEYDLLKREQVRRERVHPDVLSPECPGPKT